MKGEGGPQRHRTDRDGNLCGDEGRGGARGTAAANSAAFFASDLAGATTGTVFNSTSGTVVD